MSQLLMMERIRKSFFGVEVLKGVDFDLSRGEVHVLLGENGAGKSTLIKILSGAYSFDEGRIMVGQQEIRPDSYGPSKAEELGIATIYQNFHLIPHLSVAENLSLSRFSRERGLVDWKRVYSEARAALERVNFQIDPRARVKDLSVARKQMLEITIALSKHARILIMDEPTAALSRKETKNLFQMIDEIKQSGIGIIFISHKLDEIKQIGDRVTILRDGFKITTLDLANADTDKIITLMVGKELTETSNYNKDANQTTIFKVENLTSTFFTAPLSFSLYENEILGITGLVGAGKTELARTIFGIEQVDNGRFLLQGKEVKIDRPQDAVKLGIGYLPEDRDSDGLCLNMGIKENITLALFAKSKLSLLQRKMEKVLVLKLIKSMDIKTAGMSRQVKYLSGGNKQKVVFGKWLEADCQILILDEPTIGIDVGARREIYQLVRNFVRQTHKSVIFISSDMTEILEVTDRILVMSSFRLKAELNPASATRQTILKYCMQNREKEESP